MTTYFVSRHVGALDWAQREGLVAERVAHLDPNTINPGDIVLGTLPIQLAAEVTARGARYLHLEIDLTPELRGQDLTADQMKDCNARLTEFKIERIGTHKRVEAD
jgi:CRISPR-associated protein Csx16